MAACPAGHESASDDFCDVCGTRIGGSPGSSQGRPTGRHHGLDRGAANRGLTCPGCGAPVSGMFCEACGFSHRARRPFVPPVPPPDPFTSGPPVSKPGSPPWERMEPPSSWSPPESPPPSSWSRQEPPPALGGRPESPPFPPVQPGPPDEAADSAVTDLLASLFSPVAPPRSEPSSFPAPVGRPAPVARPEPPAPPAPRPEPAPDRNAPIVSRGPSAPPTRPAPVFTPVTWTALIASDRGYYDRMKAVRGRSGSDVAFPARAIERRIPLAGKQMRIGRRSAARELEPEIDLAQPPVDPGISRLHAMLIAAPDGTWSVLDPGSANGTLVNGREAFRPDSGSPRRRRAAPGGGLA